MNTENIRRKRILIPAIGTVAALAIGGTAWSASANNVTGSERDRIAEAAIKIAGGGTAEDVEHSDDIGEAYEVEVRRKDGTEVEISLDKNLKEVRTEVDDDRDNDDDGDGRDNDDDGDADDRALGAKEKSAATKAALKAVGGGTATDVEASDDPGEAYEVEVRTKQGVEWDVDLDRNFAVVSKKKDS
jgi:uncharacterized membrane protein YkoI